MSLAAIMWTCIALTVLLGVPFILLWWRDMDKWANDEHKRFKPSKPELPARTLVVAWPSPQQPVPSPHPDPNPGPIPDPGAHAIQHTEQPTAESSPTPPHDEDPLTPLSSSASNPMPSHPRA